jgi:hypothetical protein
MEDNLRELTRRIKNENDSMLEAVKRALKGTQDELSPSELLVIDNEVRKENGMPELNGYPIVLDSYSPATQKSTWKKLVKLVITRPKGKLPTADLIFAECEGVDQLISKDDLDEMVDKRFKEQFPGVQMDKTEKDAIKRGIRLSIIKLKELELAGISKGVAKEDEEKRGPGRPKK